MIDFFFSIEKQMIDFFFFIEKQSDIRIYHAVAHKMWGYWMYVYNRIHGGVGLWILSGKTIKKYNSQDNFNVAWSPFHVWTLT